MARHISRRAGFGALISSMLAALQWRLLLLWLLLMLLPATLVALPVWMTLGGLLDHSEHATAWAQHFSGLMFGSMPDVLAGHMAWFSGVALLGLGLTLLLSPFLDGMIISCGRNGRGSGFYGLLQGGLIEYGRMFRVMLWSLLPYLVAVAVAALGIKMADHRSERAVLESQATTFSHLALWLSVMFFVLAQAVVESMRAAFIADPLLRSATRGLARGFMQLMRRPLGTLLFYLLVSVVGLAIAAALGLARIHTVAASSGGFWLGLLWSQLMVLTIGWMRTARLFSLAEVARSMR